MAAANEIDQALMDLLTQNIEAAKSAGQVRVTHADIIAS